MTRSASQYTTADRAAEQSVAGGHVRFDAVQMRFRAEKERPAVDGRRGHAAALQRVSGQLFELAARMAIVLFKSLFRMIPHGLVIFPIIENHSGGVLKILFSAARNT